MRMAHLALDAHPRQAPPVRAVNCHGTEQRTGFLVRPAAAKAKEATCPCCVPDRRPESNRNINKKQQVGWSLKTAGHRRSRSPSPRGKAARAALSAYRGRCRSATSTAVVATPPRPWSSHRLLAWTAWRWRGRCLHGQLVAALLHSLVQHHLRATSEENKRTPTTGKQVLRPIRAPHHRHFGKNRRCAGVAKPAWPRLPRGGGGLSPKRLCIYSLLSMCGCCPRREQSAHVGASPPPPRSLGCGGGGTPPKGLWPRGGGRGSTRRLG
jgi:hypothetical protein